MSSDFRGSTAIKMREMRRLELLEQAEQYRLAELADAGNPEPAAVPHRCEKRHRIDHNPIRWAEPVKGSEPPIDLEPSASKSA